ncbi:hypothetical protein DMENIID0001_010830 [Sergentomyia squamirostris]
MLLVICLMWLMTVVNSAPKSCPTTVLFPDIVPTKGEPVYLIRTEDGNQKAFHPEGHKTTLKPGNSLQFYCPKEKRIETANTSCKSNLARKEEKISCKGNVASEVKETNRKCGKTGKLYIVTLPMPSNEFHTIYSTCFNKTTLNPIYSIHILNGKSVGHHVKQERGNFKMGKNIYSNTNINNLYKEHIEKFRGIFGPNQKFFQRPLYSLARGHLTPEVDFALGTEQHATEFYINTAPQFQVINQGNWLRVEKHVRDLAETLQDDVTVITGVLGILKLPNQNGEQKKIYLGDGVIPVPEIFWKIVLHEKSLSAIVFIGSNNPHLNSFPPICPNICNETTFGDGEKSKSQNFSDGKLGFIICCRLHDFLKKNSDILPDEENIKWRKYESVLGRKEGGIN